MESFLQGPNVLEQPEKELLQLEPDLEVLNTEVDSSISA
jgi:hypothetical protein